MRRRRQFLRRRCQLLGRRIDFLQQSAQRLAHFAKLVTHLAELVTALHTLILDTEITARQIAADLYHSKQRIGNLFGNEENEDEQQHADHGTCNQHIANCRLDARHVLGKLFVGYVKNFFFDQDDLLLNFGRHRLPDLIIVIARLITLSGSRQLQSVLTNLLEFRPSVPEVGQTLLRIGSALDRFGITRQFLFDIF